MNCPGSSGERGAPSASTWFTYRPPPALPIIHSPPTILLETKPRPCKMPWRSWAAKAAVRRRPPSVWSHYPQKRSKQALSLPSSLPSRQVLTSWQLPCQLAKAGRAEEAPCDARQPGWRTSLLCSAQAGREGAGRDDSGSSDISPGLPDYN